MSLKNKHLNLSYKDSHYPEFFKKHHNLVLQHQLVVALEQRYQAAFLNKEGNSFYFEIITFSEQKSK